MVKHRVKLREGRKSNKADDRRTLFEKVMSFLGTCKSPREIYQHGQLGHATESEREWYTFSRGPSSVGYQGLQAPSSVITGVWRGTGSAHCQHLYLTVLSYGNYLKGKCYPPCSPLATFRAHQQHRWNPLSRRQKEVLPWVHWASGLVRKSKD